MKKIKKNKLKSTCRTTNSCAGKQSISYYKIFIKIIYNITISQIFWTPSIILEKKCWCYLVTEQR
jgi:hypothetical protein